MCIALQDDDDDDNNNSSNNKLQAQAPLLL